MEKYKIRIHKNVKFGKFEICPTCCESELDKQVNVETIYMIPLDMAKEISKQYIELLEKVIERGIENDKQINMV